MRAARRSYWAAILAHGRAWLVAPRPDLATLDRLLALTQQRLTLMQEVARWKWNAGQPVTDRSASANCCKALWNAPGAMELSRSWCASCRRTGVARVGVIDV